MSQMTLKQRRRHRELEDAFHRLKDNPYLQIPEDYEFGINVEEDKNTSRSSRNFRPWLPKCTRLKKSHAPDTDHTYYSKERR